MTVIVAAGVIEVEGRVLVTRRQAGVHLEGCWEFPGGKCEAHETPAACLAREILEELGVAAAIGRELFRTTHEYADRTIQLHFLECRLLGAPSAQLGQEMRWVARADLATLPFPPADAAFIARLTA
jgi:8-oxo-dGTP diphosphatase